MLTSSVLDFSSVWLYNGQNGKNGQTLRAAQDHPGNEVILRHLPTSRVPCWPASLPALHRSQILEIKGTCTIFVLRPRRIYTPSWPIRTWQSSTIKRFLWWHRNNTRKSFNIQFLGLAPPFLLSPPNGDSPTISDLSDRLSLP